MILDPESWMDIRRFRALREAGVSIAEIARETGHDWKTVKKYLAADGPVAPPAAPPRKGTQPLVIAPFTGVVDAWLRRDITLRASVIHERLAAEHGFTGHYQRVKMYVAQARPRIAAEIAACDGNPLAGLHRRFGVVPGAIVYDRVQTVVRRHVGPGCAVPLHPEAAAFAAHYGFVIDVLAAYRPMGKGRVERQVNIVREHVLAGRSFDSLGQLDAAFAAWLPVRRGQVHRTHGQVIAVRAEADRAALLPLPDRPYLVTEKHLRRVGKDALVSFEASYYSVPARQIRPGQQVQLQVDGDTVSLHALPGDWGADGGGWLATHRRAHERGSWVVDPAHWDGLPDGHTRAVVLEPPTRPSSRPSSPPSMSAATGDRLEPLSSLLSRRHADITVAARPLADYDTAAASMTRDVTR